MFVLHPTHPWWLEGEGRMVWNTVLLRPTHTRCANNVCWCGTFWMMERSAQKFSDHSEMFQSGLIYAIPVSLLGQCDMVCSGVTWWGIHLLLLLNPNNVRPSIYSAVVPSENQACWLAMTDWRHTYSDTYHVTIATGCYVECDVISLTWTWHDFSLK